MNFRKYLATINFKTLYFNFRYLPFKQAIKLPFFISPNTILRKTGGSCQITAPIKTGMVRIGFGSVGIFDRRRSKSIWEVSGNVVFNGKTFIGHGSKICVAESGVLTFGDDFRINAETSIICYKSVSFGSNCLLSWEILIMDTDFHPMLNAEGTRINEDAAVVLGNDIWIGCRALILKGSDIASGCIVGASSLVSRPLPVAAGLYAGNPAKLLKENVRWEE